MNKLKLTFLAAGLAVSALALANNNPKTFSANSHLSVRLIHVGKVGNPKDLTCPPEGYIPDPFDICVYNPNDDYPTHSDYVTTLGWVKYEVPQGDEGVFPANTPYPDTSDVYVYDYTKNNLIDFVPNAPNYYLVIPQPSKTK